jgi:hypothetical protein
MRAWLMYQACVSAPKASQMMPSSSSSFVADGAQLGAAGGVVLFFVFGLFLFGQADDAL